MRQVYLYNHVDDAWESRLGAWLRHQSAMAVNGAETWLVTGTFAQANWLRRKALNEAWTVYGIRFFDLRTLRQHLYKIYSLPTPSFGRETLLLLLRAAAQENIHSPQSSYPACGPLLDGLAELAGAGFLQNERQSGNALEEAFAIVSAPPELRSTLQKLLQSPYWRPQADLELLKRVERSEGVSMGVFGLDAGAMLELNLILAAARHAANVQFWISQPLGRETLAFRWITRLEEQLTAGSSVCPSGTTSRPYESFLVNSRGVHEHRIQAPEVLIGDRWHNQITGIVEHVARLVNKNAGSIAIIVPDRSPSGNAIVNGLIWKGIAAADEVREVRQIAISSHIQCLIAQFLAEGGPPEVFLRLVERICRSPETCRQFRRSLFRTFDRLQDRSTFRLIDDAQRERFPWLRSLEILLQPWPDRASWGELRQHWESLQRNLSSLLVTHADLLKGIKFDPSDFEPLWHEIGQFLLDRKLPSKLFLQFIAELIATPSRERHPESAHRYAQVVVTTVTRAQGTSWDNVILTDCIHEDWSRPPSSVLREDARIRLRERGFFLFTAADLRELEEERILQAAYHARRNLTLTRYEQDAAENGIPANDLVTFAEQLSKCKITRHQSTKKSALAQAGKRLAEIHRCRVDPNAPFDEFFLTFPGFTARAWHPSELEMVIKAPATIAYRLMYRCEREVSREFYRSASLTIGRVVHRLLQDAFGGKGEFLSIDLAISAERGSVRTVLEKRIRKGVNEWKTSLPFVDLWWDTILRKAALLSFRILDELETKLVPGFWFQAEGQYQATRAGEANLRLEGRTDLIISDRSGLRDARVLICDFKTSKEIAYFNLTAGDGLQFLGYKLLVELNGAREIQALLIQPGGARLIRFPGAEELNQMSERLGRLQADLRFGRRPNQKFGRSEELPIATVPIDDRVLDQKHSLE